MEQEIKDFIEAEMADFGALFKQQRQDYLSRKISASGDLSKSIDYAIDKQARAEAIEMVIMFEEHGRFIDMKRLKAVVPGGANNEYVRMVEDWIRARGWEQKFIDAFVRKRHLKKAPPSVLRQIAWGIVIKRAQKVRPRKWYNKAKTASIADLFNHVVAGLPDKTSEILVNSFK